MIVLGGPEPDGVEFTGIDGGAPHRGGAGGARAGRGDRDRPLEPRHLDRPDPRGPGHARRACGCAAPVVAVSPFVGGRSVKGPTEEFCRWAGLELGAAGAAAAYEGVIDGMVADEPAPGDELPWLTVPR